MVVIQKLDINPSVNRLSIADNSVNKCRKYLH